MSEFRRPTDTRPHMPDLRISKGQALGNDYLVLDSADLARALGGGRSDSRGGERPWGRLELPPPDRLRAGAPAEPRLIATLAKRACDRHFGLGSDGLLLARLDTQPVQLRIINPDGTEAEKSGNGLRIFGAWLHSRGHAGRAAFRVRLPKDEVEMQVLGVAEDGSRDIVVQMGPASFRGADVGFAPEAGEEALGHRLDLGDGLEAEVNPLSLANPHCVVIVDTLDRDDFLARAPRLCVHPAFAAGTNVQFARIAGPDRVEAWIWERGAGETLASGSSASAVAAVALRRGLLESREITVEMVGGSAEIRVSESWEVRLRAPAQPLYQATVAAEVLEGWLGEA